MEDIEQHIEALIFASEQGIRAEEIMYCLQVLFSKDFIVSDIDKHIHHINQKYEHENLAIGLVKINNSYQFLTKKKFHPVISLLQSQRSKKKLSQAAMETLAIIAYKQPVTKTDIEQIRGVNCDYSIQKLLEKELIAITGNANTAGKPILYSTSALFMDYFGINDITQLPQLKELNDNSSTIGEQAE